MLRSEIRARIFHGLNESTTPVFWSTSEMDEVIDEAAEVLAEEAGAIKRTAFVPLQPMQTYYSIRVVAPDVMAPWRVWSYTNGWRLNAVSITALDARHMTWATVTGDPQSWFPVSYETFGIWPTPASAGGVLRVDYLAWPRALLDDDDEPEFPEADHEALVVYGIYDGLAKRWDARRCVEAYSVFTKQWGISRSRTGHRRVQSRIAQRGEAVLDPPGGVGLP